jgi:hypothetical protein
MTSVVKSIGQNWAKNGNAPVRSVAAQSVFFAEINRNWKFGQFAQAFRAVAIMRHFPVLRDISSVFPTKHRQIPVSGSFFKNFHFFSKWGG